MSAPRALQGIGINIFITYFETFNQLQDRRRIADFCMKNGISNEAGANIRGSYMEQVLNDKALLQECLEYIVNHAKNVSLEHKEKAKKLMKDNK